MSRRHVSPAVVAAFVSSLALAQAAAQGVEPCPRQVSVVGHGTVRVLPDTVNVTFGVRSTDPVVAKAKATVDKAVTGILQACDGLAIARSAVTATQLEVGRDYDHGSDRAKLPGYEVIRSVTVSLTNLGSFNDLVQRAIGAGANEVENIELKTSKESDLTLQALSKAIQDARSQAEHIARELGQQLGEARSVSTGEATRLAMYSPLMESVAVNARRSSVPVPEEFRPGPIEVSAQVQCTFELE